MELLIMNSISFPISWIIIMGILVVLGSYLWYCSYYGKYKKPFPNIPVVPLAFNPCNATSSDDLLLIFRERGPIFQFLHHGKYALFINDPKLVKSCFEEMEGWEHDDDMTTIYICRLIFGGNHNSIRDKIKRHHLHLKACSGEKFRKWSDVAAQATLHDFCRMLDTFVDEEQRFDVKALMGRFILDSIFREFFDMKFDFLQNAVSYQELIDGIEFMHKIVSAGDYSSPMYSFEKVFQRNAETRHHKEVIIQYMGRILDHLELKELNHTFEGDPWGQYMMKAAKDEHMDKNSLLFEILYIIIKGHALTTAALVGIVYGLVSNAIIQTKCAQLVIQNSIFKTKSPSKISSSVLPDYVEGIIKESLRRYALNGQYLVKTVSQENGPWSLHLQHLNDDDSLQHQREFLVDNKYSDWLQIPDSATVFVSLGCLHNDERNWGTTALNFQPKRWILNAAFNSIAAYSGVGYLPNEYCFVPFSVGTRKCGGMAPALLHIRSFVSTVFRQYRFKVDEDPTEENIAAPLQIKPFFVQAFYN